MIAATSLTSSLKVFNLLFATTFLASFVCTMLHFS
jgi:hypothetical protein